jgi:hypothetical protein
MYCGVTRLKKWTRQVYVLPAESAAVGYHLPGRWAGVPWTRVCVLPSRPRKAVEFSSIHTRHRCSPRACLPSCCLRPPEMHNNNNIIYLYENFNNRNQIKKKYSENDNKFNYSRQIRCETWFQRSIRTWRTDRWHTVVPRSWAVCNWFGLVRFARLKAHKIWPVMVYISIFQLF